MARGKSERDWDHTSSLLALTANVHRDPRRNRRGFTPRDFHPHERRKKRKGGAAALHALKSLFTDD